HRLEGQGGCRRPREGRARGARQGEGNPKGHRRSDRQEEGHGDERQMRRAIFVVVLVAACGSVKPKPPELDALQALRKTKEADGAAKQLPDQIKVVDIREHHSKGLWKDGELEVSRRDALLGWIKLKRAIAEWEQTNAKARIQAADADKAKSDKEFARLNKDLTALQEQIALLEKLSNAKSATEIERLKGEQEKQKLSAELAQRDA